MIQTKTRNRQFLRRMDEKLERTDPLGPSKGFVAGGLISALIWGLIAVVIA